MGSDTKKREACCYKENKQKKEKEEEEINLESNCFLFPRSLSEELRMD
jgi:hypothetical protein